MGFAATFYGQKFYVLPDGSRKYTAGIAFFASTATPGAR